MGIREANPLASVLLSFRAVNARSFRDETELSMLSTALADRDVVRQVNWREGGSPLGVLPAAGIFGANGSGKTNVLRLMSDMRECVLHSFRSGDLSGGVLRRPFLLDPVSSKAPSRFEIDLVLEGVRHQYGFVFDSEQFLEEWAYRYPRGRAAMLFHRCGDKVDLGASNRSKGRVVLELLRPNALFLSTAASANHPALLPLYEWFGRNLHCAEAPTRSYRQAFTAQMLGDDARGKRVLDLLRAADLGVTGARTLKLDAAMRNRLERGLRILAGEEAETDGGGHMVVDEPYVRLVHRAAQGEFELDQSHESRGALVWFSLVGPVIDALENGSVLLTDELDASLHPMLVNELVRLFQDTTTNPHRAQLILNSHDVTLLGDSQGRPLGRDQIWFTEKLEDGSTRLFPLSDLDPRKEEAIARRYMARRHGAAPILSSHDFDDVAHRITIGHPTNRS